jgi:plastocyanin
VISTITERFYKIINKSTLETLKTNKQELEDLFETVGIAESYFISELIQVDAHIPNITGGKFPSKSGMSLKDKQCVDLVYLENTALDLVLNLSSELGECMRSLLIGNYSSVSRSLRWILEYTLFCTYIKNDRKQSAKDRFDHYYEERMTKTNFNYLSRQVFDMNACLLDERLRFKEQHVEPKFEQMVNNLSTFAKVSKGFQKIQERIRKLYREFSGVIHPSKDSIDQIRMSGRLPIFMHYYLDEETFELTLEKIWETIDLIISIIVIEASIFYGYKDVHEYLVCTGSYYQRYPVYLRQSNTNKLINHISKNRQTKFPVFLSLTTEKRVEASVCAMEFKPDPIRITLGSTISWINKDNNSHTVTSGEGVADPKKGKKFDSCLSGDTALTKEGKVFEHRFDSVGEFSYFCQLHPNKVGKVIVYKDKLIKANKKSSHKHIADQNNK